MRTVLLGPLQTAVVSTPEYEQAPPERRLTLMLLHGYGAPGTDLVSLGSELARLLPSRPLQFVFPMARRLLDGAADPAWAGRMWWPIDMVSLQRVAMSRSFEELARAKPSGLEAARAELGEAIAALENQLNVPRARLVLGGFSQGAMLSADWTFRTSPAPRALVLLSGTFIARDEWLPLFANRRGLPVFQSHSPDDFVLPYELALELHAQLKNAGLMARFHEFAGGHGVSRTVLSELASFLDELEPSGQSPSHLPLQP